MLFSIETTNYIHYLDIFGKFKPNDVDTLILSEVRKLAQP